MYRDDTLGAKLLRTPQIPAVFNWVQIITDTKKCLTNLILSEDYAKNKIKKWIFTYFSKNHERSEADGIPMSWKAFISVGFHGSLSEPVGISKKCYILKNLE